MCEDSDVRLGDTGSTPTTMDLKYRWVAWPIHCKASGALLMCGLHFVNTKRFIKGSVLLLCRGVKLDTLFDL